MKAGRFEVSVSLPLVGRRRMAFTCALAATATALWFCAAFKGLAGMRPCWQIVVGGLAIPWGIGWVTLLLMERRVVRDLKRVEHRPLPEHDRAGAR